MIQQDKLTMDCGCVIHRDGSRVWCATCGAAQPRPGDAEVVDPEPAQQPPPGVAEAQELHDRDWGVEPGPEDYLARAKWYTRNSEGDTTETYALISIAESLEKMAAAMAKDGTLQKELSYISAALRNRRR